MGGPVVRHEPESLSSLLQFPAAYKKFEEAGWINYFEWLRGFDSVVALEFAQNLEIDHSRVGGIRVEVTEETIEEVIGLPRTGTQWFCQKMPLPTAKTKFLEEGEEVQPRGRGTTLESLPHPWKQVAIFLKKYITCEGRYKVVYNHDFILLSHLHHGRLVNMPYYLLKTLQNMAHYARRERVPVTCITNHGLIKLLVDRALNLQNRAPPRLIANNAEEEAEIETGSDERNENNLEEEGKKSGETEKINSPAAMSETVMHSDHNDQEGFDPDYVDQEEPT
jgi:hypothetical protein